MIGIMIFCYIIMVYGLTNLLVYGSGPFNIIHRFREFCEKIHYTLYDMLQCMMCTSTNVGLILSLVNLIIIPKTPFTPFNVLLANPSLWWLIIPLDAFFTSGCVWLLHTLQECLESTTNRNNEL